MNKKFEIKYTYDRNHKPTGYVLEEDNIIEVQEFAEWALQRDSNLSDHRLLPVSGTEVYGIDIRTIYCYNKFNIITNIFKTDSYSNFSFLHYCVEKDLTEDCFVIQFWKFYINENLYSLQKEVKYERVYSRNLNNYLYRVTKTYNYECYKNIQIKRFVYDNYIIEKLVKINVYEKVIFLPFDLLFVSIYNFVCLYSLMNFFIHTINDMRLFKRITIHFTPIVHIYLRRKTKHQIKEAIPNEIVFHEKNYRYNEIKSKMDQGDAYIHESYFKEHLWNIEKTKLNKIKSEFLYEATSVI